MIDHAQTTDDKYCHALQYKQGKLSHHEQYDDEVNKTREIVEAIKIFINSEKVGS